MASQRFGSVIRLRPEAINEYERLHRKVWPEVLATIANCHFTNYSIFRYHDLLFSYLEYEGEDYDADMAAMAADPATQRWWDVCTPLQAQTEDRVEGAWWTPVAEVFHVD